MTEIEKGRVGSTLDSFLDEDGIREDVEAQAPKEVIAWQVEQAMKAQSLSKGAAGGDEPGAARPAARSGEHVRHAAHVAEGGGRGGEAAAAGAGVGGRSHDGFDRGHVLVAPDVLLEFRRERVSPMPLRAFLGRTGRGRGTG